MTSHHYNKIEVTDIAELLEFKITGVFLLNTNVFGEEEFTEIPEELNSDIQAEASELGEFFEQKNYLDPKPGTSRDPGPSYVPSRHNEINMRQVTLPLAECNKEPRAQSKKNMCQRRIVHHQQ